MDPTFPLMLLDNAFLHPVQFVTFCYSLQAKKVSKDAILIGTLMCKISCVSPLILKYNRS